MLFTQKIIQNYSQSIGCSDDVTMTLLCPLSAGFSSLRRVDYKGLKYFYSCFYHFHFISKGNAYPRSLICLNNNDCDGMDFIIGASCQWFSNGTSFIKKPTLFNQSLRTYSKVEDPSKVLYTPWRAPGAAPIQSPCGVSGGKVQRSLTLLDSGFVESQIFRKGVSYFWNIRNKVQIGAPEFFITWMEL